jgi:membrane protein YdbS with pleckstrin-like domain
VSAPATEEHVLFDARCHGIVLARPLGWAVAAALAALLALAFGWPLSLAAPPLLATAALVALQAVSRWERTRLVVTTESVFVVRGVLRRRFVAVPLGSVAAIGLDQTLAGRLLGYGTLLVGPIQVENVSRPQDVAGLVERLCA